jgi:hypothetical protein
MNLLTAKPLALTLHVSISSLARWRRTKQLEEGVHYFKTSPTSILYNVELIYDWLANKHQPELHERAIENFLAALPSSQPKPDRKPNKKAAKTAS